MMLLEVSRVSKHFGGVAALSNVDFIVSESEIVGLIGPNGAGKTTLFNVVTGFLPVTNGTISFGGEDITGLRSDQITRKGISRTFQASVLYTQASCFENVLIGCHMHYREPKWKAFLHTEAYREEEHTMKQNTDELLEFMGLAEYRDRFAGELPHGQQRVLGICIALATKPRLLLLDEPATGMNAKETALVMERIRRLRKKGITIVLVEHNVRAVLGVCDRIVVLDHGQKIAEGMPEEIMKSPAVIEAYLGRKDDSVARG
jgi:branched-chain amino acid transport system ATP-binding protein